MRSSVVVLGLVTSFGTSFGGCGFSSPGATFDGDLTLSGTITYDTATHELRVDGAVMPVAHMTLTANAGDVDAIFAHDVRLTAGATLRATGKLPFAIVVSGSVTIEDGASIDVGNGGAGALTVCSNPPMPGGDNPGGAAGGGGGGYGAAGGDGGQGNLDGTRSQGGARSNSIAMPAGPRGGCPGAPGGTGNSPGGLGGLAGGALYIAAADRIELLGNSAALTAGGGGGQGGTQGSNNPSGDAGGGGGGSGGMIFLEAPHVLGPQARVAANGGGGGEGSTTGTPGRNGNTGSTSTSRAAGGAGGSPDSADGGRGGSLQSLTGETVTTCLKGGGGGGGGGVGYVHIVSPDVQIGSISPARS